jgi:hypothetical protein
MGEYNMGDVKWQKTWHTPSGRIYLTGDVGWDNTYDWCIEISDDETGIEAWDFK